MTENLLDEFKEKTKRKSKQIDVVDNKLFVNLKTVKQTSYFTIGLNTELKFGKYKGSIVRDILAKDPEYLAWMSSKYKMTTEVMEALNGES